MPSRVSDLATWPSGLGNGLQSRLPGFDSRRRLHTAALDSGARSRLSGAQSGELGAVGAVSAPGAVGVALNAERAFFVQVMGPAERTPVAGHRRAMRTPTQGVVGITPGHGPVTAGPNALGGQGHDGLAGGAGEQS